MKQIVLPLLAASLAAQPVLADPIPRLPDGPHLGMIVGFDDPGPRLGQVQALWDQAVEAGMTVGRVQIDWSGLEPAPGQYDATEFRDALAFAERGGMHVYVTLSTLDSEELTLPADLIGPDGALNGGLRLDDPDVLARFDAFLAWFVPQLTEADIWGLSLANEFDNLINEGAVSADEVLTFLSHGMDTVRALDPDLAVTATFSGGAVTTLPDFTAALIDRADLVAYNTYCLTDWITVNGPAAWQSKLDLWKRFAGDKPIFLQELGCPVGYGALTSGPYAGEPTHIGGSRDIQADYVAFHMAAFAEDPQLRAATFFQLLDWSPEVTAHYGAATEFTEEGEIWFRLEEWLATSGFCRSEDLSCGPAWQVWLDGLATLPN